MAPCSFYASKRPMYLQAVVLLMSKDIPAGEHSCSSERNSPKNKNRSVISKIRWYSHDGLCDILYPGGMQNENSELCVGQY